MLRPLVLFKLNWKKCALYCFRFVSFSSQDSMQSALSTFNGYEIEGKRLNLQTDDRSSSSTDISQQDRRKGNPPSSSMTNNTNQIKVLSCPASLSEVGCKNIGKFLSLIFIALEC